MSSEPPKLRGKAKARPSLYPFGELPDDVVLSIGCLIVHRLAVGHADITGNDFADIFADSISGKHLLKPLGVTDVVWNECSWSAKTVKHAKPFKKKEVRLITGRNSPIFSYGIKDPLEDVAKTGRAVLQIWNERVNQSFNEFSDLRIVVMIRDMDALEFCLFEYDASRYTPSDYLWEKNKKNNLVGYDKSTGKHVFTWQPHGSQFTVIKSVPASACKFRIKRHPGVVEPQHILRLARFSNDWIEHVR